MAIADEQKQQDVAAEHAKASDEYAIINCGTNVGSITIELYRLWSPNGYDKSVTLFERGYYDTTHFFRMVPNFLVQFGITYSTDSTLKQLGLHQIQDDVQWQPPIPFTPGTMSFAGGGPNSRSSQLFIAFGKGSFGRELWETPIGRVIEGYEDVVLNFYSDYGDMPPWGNGPVQHKIHNGPDYINNNFPELSKFTTCTVQRFNKDNHLVVAEEHSKDSVGNGISGRSSSDERTQLRRKKEVLLDSRRVEEDKLQHLHNEEDHHEPPPNDNGQQQQHDGRGSDKHHVPIQHHHVGHDTEHHHHHLSNGFNKINHALTPIHTGITIFSLELTTLCVLSFGAILVLWIIFTFCRGSRYYTNKNTRKTK